MNPPGRQVPNMQLEKSRETALEVMKTVSQSRNDTQLWMCLVVKVKSHTVNNNIVQEPGMSGHNQDKLEVVKQEMARVNINILWISELKWAGKAKIIQKTIISTTVGKNPLGEME